MKVRITYTVEVGDFYRRAIRHHFGQSGLATRAEVKEWIRQHGSSHDDDITWDLQQADEQEERAGEAAEAVMNATIITRS